MKAAVVVLTAACAMAQPRPLERDHPVRREVARLYERIVAVTAGSRTAPELVVKAGEGPSEVAWYTFQGRAAIGLGERAYKLCSAMGAQAEGCLAFLLGHELAHFHHNDAWGTELAPLLDRQGITRTSIAEMEERADYFGILSGYAAGVDMRGAPARVLDAVYRSYTVTNPLYPGRDQRLALAAEAERRASSMIPLFAAGLRLMLAGEPGWAARCFDAIGEGFQSREVINNQGAARLLEAIALSDPATVRFAYPVEVDPRGRLSERSTRGSGEGSAERRRLLLEQARDRLERGHQEDRGYAPYPGFPFWVSRTPTVYTNASLPCRI